MRLGIIGAIDIFRIFNSFQETAFDKRCTAKTPRHRQVQSIPKILRNGLKSQRAKQIACASLPILKIKLIISKQLKDAVPGSSKSKSKIKKTGTYSEKLPCARTFRSSFVGGTSLSILKINFITGLPLRYPILKESSK